MTVLDHILRSETLLPDYDVWHCSLYYMAKEGKL